MTLVARCVLFSAAVCIGACSSFAPAPAPEAPKVASRATEPVRTAAKEAPAKKSPPDELAAKKSPPKEAAEEAAKVVAQEEQPEPPASKPRASEAAPKTSETHKPASATRKAQAAAPHTIAPKSSATETVRKPAPAAEPPAPKHAPAAEAGAAKAQPAAEPKRAPAAQPAAPKPAPLDLKTLEQRLKDTSAIGVLTKLSLKNQVDDLVDRFRAYHDGKRPPTLAELRPGFELLLMKVLSLLQDKDPGLAHDVNASRDAIWSVLADKQKFAEFS